MVLTPPSTARRERRRAIQVSPLRHSRLQAGLVGTKGLAGYSRTLPGRIHQPPVARGAASGQSGSAQMRAVIILGQTAPHSAPNSHVQEVLRTSYGSGTSNGRHSGIPGPSYIQHPANIRVSANHTVRSVTAIQQSWKHSIAPVDSQGVSAQTRIHKVAGCGYHWLHLYRDAIAYKRSRSNCFFFSTRASWVYTPRARSVNPALIRTRD